MYLSIKSKSIHYGAFQGVTLYIFYYLIIVIDTLTQRGRSNYLTTSYTVEQFNPQYIICTVVKVNILCVPPVCAELYWLTLHVSFSSEMCTYVQRSATLHVAKWQFNMQQNFTLLQMEMVRGARSRRFFNLSKSFAWGTSDMQSASNRIPDIVYLWPIMLTTNISHVHL